MKLLAVISLSTALFTLIGCDSDMHGDTTERPEGSRPTSSMDLTFFDDIAMARIAPNEPGDVINILSNPDFENGLSGWHACKTASISESTDGASGISALELKQKQCIYQSVKATPGLTYTVNCQVKLTENKAWTALGVNAYNSNFDVLEESAPAMVTSEKYTRVDTEVSTPANTKWLSVWVYSDHGALVDDCHLTLEPNERPAIDIPTQDPTDAEEPASNLLYNGNFSSQIDAGNAFWTLGCGGSRSVFDGAMSILDGACIDQALDSGRVSKINNKTTTFSCLVKSVNGYSDLSVFINGDLAGSKTVDSDDVNRRVSLPFMAANAENAFVSLYSEGNLQVDNCELVVDGSDNTEETDTDETDDTVVVFEGTYFEDYIRGSLRGAGVTLDPNAPVTRAHMAKLTSFRWSSNIPALGPQFENITGLEHAINLEEFCITGDASVEIKDLTPLSGLKKLRRFCITSFKIEDISALTNLMNLEFIWFQNSKFTDLSPLQGLPKLESLYLRQTGVADLSPVASLPKLKSLTLIWNELDSLQPLVDGTFGSNADSSLFVSIDIDFAANSPNLIALHTLMDRGAVGKLYVGVRRTTISRIPPIDEGLCVPVQSDDCRWQPLSGGN